MTKRHVIPLVFLAYTVGHARGWKRGNKSGWLTGVMQGAVLMQRSSRRVHDAKAYAATWN
jgi:hypothetical protein